MSFIKYGVTPFLVTFALLFSVSKAHSCACGCGLFDVGTSAVLPNGPGGTVWMEYDYASQDHNQHGSGRTSDLDNENKKIRSNLYTVGGQYMFNREWGVRATVPFVDRNFVATDEDSGDTVSLNDRHIGDIHLQGVYSGFSPDMSTGVTFGLKLPTGDTGAAGFDRDTSIGTGSTNLLLGAYHMGRLKDQRFAWFMHGQLDQPVLIKDNYRPGAEASAATGMYYEDWAIRKLKITPVLQLVGTQRFHDTGSNSDPDNTGYSQAFISPGVEFGIGNTKFYGDVAVPVYQHVRGDQLVPGAVFKLRALYEF
jgi:hypothetical protein